MDKHNQIPTLDDVLDAYVDAVALPSHPALLEWIRRYPQYERELTAFTVNWSRIEHSHLVTDVAETDEDTLVLRGMSIVQNLLHAQRTLNRESEQAEVPAIAGLLREGNRLGLKLPSLAAAVGLTPALVREIDRRLIALASIPREAIEAFAQALRCAPQAVERYLKGTPKFAAGAQYRADEAPVLAEQRDFFVAVREDSSMSPEQKARWLALAPDED